MNRYLWRLAAIGLAIIGTGVVVTALGYSGTAAVLGMMTAAALCWAPTLIALEGLERTRDEDT